MIFLHIRNWFPFQGRFPRARLQLIFSLGTPAVTSRKIHFAVPAGVAPPLQPIYKVSNF